MGCSGHEVRKQQAEAGTPDQRAIHFTFKECFSRASSVPDTQSLGFINKTNIPALLELAFKWEEIKTKTQ